MLTYVQHTNIQICSINYMLTHVHYTLTQIIQTEVWQGYTVLYTCSETLMSTRHTSKQLQDGLGSTILLWANDYEAAGQSVIVWDWILEIHKHLHICLLVVWLKTMLLFSYTHSRFRGTSYYTVHHTVMDVYMHQYVYRTSHHKQPK